METVICQLYCPICGNDMFISLDTDMEELMDAPDDTRLQCSDCKNVFMKKDLIEDNHDVIMASVDDLVQDVLKETEKKLKKAFR